LQDFIRPHVANSKWVVPGIFIRTTTPLVSEKMGREKNGCNYSGKYRFALIHGTNLGSI
jgi:hypothetical protein